MILNLFPSVLRGVLCASILSRRRGCSPNGHFETPVAPIQLVAVLLNSGSRDRIWTTRAGRVNKTKYALNRTGP
jgi:hypothetical protein